MFDELPEICRSDCPIARIAIRQVISEGRESEYPLGRVQGCPGEPKKVTKGTCGEVVQICSHPGSTESEDYKVQVQALKVHIQS